MRIVIYQHANFLGESAHMTDDITDLEKVRGHCERRDDDGVTDSWDDCASSVRVFRR